MCRAGSRSATMQRVCAGVAQQAEQPSCKRQASGSNPLTGSQFRGVFSLIRFRLVERCRTHVCHLMKASTIRGIHSILSGAFAAAQCWEWTDRNPAESAKPPTAIRQPIPATSPDDVAKVIAEARARSTDLGLYLWLVVVTGVRRGELCGLQIRDIDLDRGLVHVASTTSSGEVSVSARTPRLPGPLAGHRPGRLRADRDLPGRDPGRAGRGRRRAARRCVPVLQRPSPLTAVEPGLGHAQGRRGRRRGRGEAGHQGRTVLHREPASGRRLRPAQHRRPPRSQRRRRDHLPPLRRPGPPKSTGAQPHTSRN